MQNIRIIKYKIIKIPKYNYINTEIENREI